MATKTKRDRQRIDALLFEGLNDHLPSPDQWPDRGSDEWESFDPFDEVNGPLFSTQEVAKIFFARSSHWMRWRDKQDSFVFDGRPVEVRRDKSGARKFDLQTIEKIAHGLAQQTLITPLQLSRTVSAMQAVADVHEMFDSAEEEAQ